MRISQESSLFTISIWKLPFFPTYACLIIFETASSTASFTSLICLGVKPILLPYFTTKFLTLTRYLLSAGNDTFFTLLTFIFFYAFFCLYWSILKIIWLKFYSQRIFNYSLGNNKNLTLPIRLIPFRNLD